MNHVMQFNERKTNELLYFRVSKVFNMEFNNQLVDSGTPETVISYR